MTSLSNFDDNKQSLSSPESAQIEQWILALKATGHKVVRPFKTNDDYTPNGGLGTDSPKILMVIDFEATGKEPAKDLPIEIGFVKVQYNPANGFLGKVLERYSALEDPGFELSPEVERVTNLKRSMLIGHRFDDEYIQKAIQSSDYLIAHNAAYDRTLGERRFKAMEEKPWGCTMVEGPWEAMGIGSRTQEFLAYKVAGIHYEAHRAMADCEALLQILASPAHDGQSCLAHVLENSGKLSYTVWADRSPFDKKDQLRNDGGYRWNNDDPGKIPKTWYKDRVKDLAAEFSFLQENIYSGPTSVTVDTMTALERFSRRFGDRQKMRIDVPAEDLSVADEPVKIPQGLFKPRFRRLS